jgi:hypothetical protein
MYSKTDSQLRNDVFTENTNRNLFVHTHLHDCEIARKIFYWPSVYVPYPVPVPSLMWAAIA